jgi:hypothetical protein
MIGSLVRRFSSSRPSGDTRAPERAVAVLVGARALLERGWIQGGWYVVQSQDGRRRFVGVGSLTRRSYGEIVAACLVGAVAESARLHSPEPGTAGPAIDALWHALGELEGHVPPADPWPPTPLIRNRHVCDLTRWNDDAARTREDVLRLVDAAVARVRARTVPAQRAPDSVDQSSSASIEAALTAPSVGTGR